MAKAKTKKKNSAAFNKKFRRKVVPYRSIMVGAFSIVIVIGLFFGYQNMLKKEQAYQESIDELNSEITELETTNESLKDQMNNMDSSEFKEHIARERLGMIGKDEVLLKESEDGNTEDTSLEEETTESTEEGDTTEEGTTESSENTEETSTATSENGEETTATSEEESSEATTHEKKPSATTQEGISEEEFE